MSEKYPSVETLIPHRYGMLLLDELTSWSETEIRCRKKVSPDDYLIEDEKLSSIALAEMVAQATAAHFNYQQKQNAGPDEKTRIGYLATIDFVFHKDPKIGDELEVQATMEKMIGNFGIVSGRVTCGGVVMAEGRLKLFNAESEG